MHVGVHLPRVHPRQEAGAAVNPHALQQSRGTYRLQSNLGSGGGILEQTFSPPAGKPTKNTSSNSELRARGPKGKLELVFFTTNPKMSKKKESYTKTT